MPRTWGDGRGGAVGASRRRPHPRLRRPGRVARGPHVENTTVLDPKGFKLTQVTGSYWRGDEKNKGLKRFHATAWATEADLKAHLAFGTHIHSCLGAPLARLEGRVAFERLFARLANIRLAADNDFMARDSLNFRGPRVLLLEFDR